jgi:hypothetical protein
MTKLNKAVEKRFDEFMKKDSSYSIEPRTGYPTLREESVKQHLAKELAKEREKIKKRAEKVVKELGLPKDYLDFMSVVFFVKLPSETKVTKHDKELVKKLSKNKHE